MNFNKTALALAVAGITAAAPIAAQAGVADIYASVRIGVWNVDKGDTDDDGNFTGGSTSDPEVKSFSSRFGVKAETDMGNGMTGFGKYEWDVDESDFNIRHRTVGVKGDFGKITLGKTYHTFYNYVVGPTDTPWWHSGYAMIEYRGRTDDAISYNYDSGAFSFGVSAYMLGREESTPAAASVDFVAVSGDDTILGTEAVAAKSNNEEAIDQLEIGVSFGLGDMTLGFALLTTEGDSIGNGSDDSDFAGAGKSDEDVLGVSLTGISLGDVSLGFAFQSQDDDTGFVADVKFGSAYLYIEQESLDASSKGNTVGDRDRLAITLGYTQTLGKDTLIYYELFSLDNDTGDSDNDNTTVMAVLKYNLI